MRSQVGVFSGVTFIMGTMIGSGIFISSRNLLKRYILVLWHMCLQIFQFKLKNFFNGTRLLLVDLTSEISDSLCSELSLPVYVSQCGEFAESTRY